MAEAGGTPRWCSSHVVNFDRFPVYGCGRVWGAQAGKGEKYCCANQAESCGGRRIRKGTVHAVSADSAVRAKLVKLEVFTEVAINRLPPERQWVCDACLQAMSRKLRPAGTPMWLVRVSIRYCAAV